MESETVLAMNMSTRLKTPALGAREGQETNLTVKVTLSKFSLPFAATIIKQKRQEKRRMLHVLYSSLIPILFTHFDGIFKLEAEVGGHTKCSQGLCCKELLPVVEHHRARVILPDNIQVVAEEGKLEERDGRRR